MIIKQQNLKIFFILKFWCQLYHYNLTISQAAILKYIMHIFIKINVKQSYENYLMKSKGLYIFSVAELSTNISNIYIKVNKYIIVIL